MIQRKRRMLFPGAAAMLFFWGGFSLSAESPVVVATTEWTAAFCRAAGIENVRVLAPSTLKHPPEYELKPSDIEILSRADVLVFAGYEVMMKRIKAQMAGDKTKLIQIETSYEPKTMEKSIRKIARSAGTIDRAEKEIRRISESRKKARQLVADAGMSGWPAAVHVFQRPFAKIAGLNILLTFGPAPPTARTITAAAGSGAKIILDNAHNPLSAPLKEVLPGAVSAESINFPGAGGTRSLADVILYNADQLTGVLK